MRLRRFLQLTQQSAAQGLQAQFTAALARTPPGDDLVGIGLDLSADTVLAAYHAGLFPMGLGRNGRLPIGWWSPDPRGVLPLDGLRVSRSLRRSVRAFEIRVDTAFDDVLAACAEPGRSGRWITRGIRRTYGQLHRRGYAHSVECWQSDRLVGGLYGVGIGGLFAGESMFHRVADASKVALVALVDLLSDERAESRLVDVQWRTSHLASLGVIDVSRSRYLELLQSTLRLPGPECWVARASPPAPLAGG